MLVLGLQGSPRQKGNTAWMMATFMEEAGRLGARTHVIDADKDDIRPCKEYVLCEKKGICPIKDDLYHTGYALLREADVIVAATPVFFYNMTAQLKALVDRCQVFWSRKYALKLKDPGAGVRRGMMFSVAASRGKQLFDAIELSIRYFFDAVDCRYDGSLVYRGAEKPGDLAAREGAADEIRQAARQLLEPLLRRRRVLFVCRENACRSQMAAAFARAGFGGEMDVMSAGDEPSAEVNPVMVKAMQELGIDMGFLTPRSLNAVLAVFKPEILVTMGCETACPTLPGARHVAWDLPDPASASLDAMRDIRDRIKEYVDRLGAEMAAGAQGV